MFHPRPLHGVSVSSPLPVRPSPERSPPKLCENGRAYITDPSTGQNVCLCQLEAHPAHSLQAHPALRGMRPIPAPRPLHGGTFHPHAAAAAAAAAQLSAMAPLGEQTNGLLPPHIAFHPYGMYASMEGPGNPLRRAATRETTGPLKAWLNEHKKNPYPTKAEKIMLAIITRMTLTQVSTWFANARRRLKKDNRLSSGDGGDADDDTSTLDMDSDREGDSDLGPVPAASSAPPPAHGVSSSPGGLVNAIGERGEILQTRDGEGHVILAGRPAGVTDAKLSSEGEGEPDSFSDISDDESENMFRSLRAGAHRAGHNSLHRPEAVSARVPVITSQPLSSSGLSESKMHRERRDHQKNDLTPEATSGVDLSIASNGQRHGGDTSKVENKPEHPKPKPKIWSIEHILDS